MENNWNVFLFSILFRHSKIFRDQARQICVFCLYSSENFDCRKLYVENDCNYVHRHTIKITYVRLDASTQGTPQYASVSFFEKNEDGKIIVFTGVRRIFYVGTQ